MIVVPAPAAAGVPAVILTLGEQTEPRSLNPLLLEGLVSGFVGSVVYAFLTTVDANGGVVADAAEAVPTHANGGISADGRTIRYRLRAGMHWHDGAPVTARDCVFTFNAIMNPRNNVPSRAGYDRIASVEAPDDRTVVVHLKQRYSPIVTTFLEVNGNYPILPEHLLRGLSDLNNLETMRYTIGSGPFRLVEWQHGDHMTFAAFDGYTRGRPKIDRIVVRFIPDLNTIRTQLQSGEIDGAPEITDPTLLPELQKIERVRIVTQPTYGALSAYINAQSALTGDVRVRRAIVRAVDWATLAARPTHGLYTMRGAFASYFGPYDAAPAVPRHDVIAAGKMLDAAGWRVGADGVRTKDGVRSVLRVAYSSGIPVAAAVAMQAQQALRGAGLDAVLRPYAPAQLMAPAAQGGPVFGGAFEVFIGNIFSNGGVDTGDFFTCDRRAPAGFNLARVCDPRIDARYRDALDRDAPDVLRRDVADMERVIIEDAVYLPLGRTRFISALSPRLSGFASSPITPYAFAWRWRLAPPRTR